MYVQFRPIGPRPSHGRSDHNNYSTVTGMTGRMSSPPPFVDHEEWTIDLREILREALPLVALVGLVGIVAYVPLIVGGGLGLAPIAFTLASQFLLVVGSGIVLLYVIARGIQLAEN